MTVSELARDKEYASDDSKGGMLQEISSATDEHPCRFAAEFSCKEKFLREADAIRHSCSHLGGVACTICDKVCTDWDTLGVHTSNEHPQEEKPQVTTRTTARQPTRYPGPYAEKFKCTNTYKIKSNAERHGKTHTIEIPCPFAAKYGCSALFARQDMANRHGRTHIEEWPCPLCSSVVERRDSLVRHLRDFHPTDGAQKLTPRFKGTDPGPPRATGHPIIKEVFEKSRVPTSEELVEEDGQFMLESADVFGREPPVEIPVPVKRNRQTHLARLLHSTTGNLPRIREEADDGESAICIHSDGPIPSFEIITAKSNPSTKPLRPTLKRTLSSASARAPSSPGNTTESSPKKRVRFSSPIDDASPRSSLRIRSISPVFKSAPLHPQFGDITFYNSFTNGYCALLIRRNISYTLSQDGHLLINGHKRFKSNELDVDPITRESRWAKDDKSLNYYYAQLLHRGLLTTRDKEVAKWRIYHQTALGQTKEETRQRVIYVNDINNELKQALRYALPNLKDQGRAVDHEEPDWDEGVEDEVKNWMVEEPKSKFMLGQVYDQVMNQWIALRSPLPTPESNVLDSGDDVRRQGSAGYSNTPSPIQLDSTQDNDGQSNDQTLPLTHPPRPDCPLCHFPQLECVCAPCQRCSNPLNWRANVTCCCYCEDCHRPIAKAFRVKRNSAPPGYYCRCKVDPDVKEHYDEVRRQKRKEIEEAERKANARAKDNDGEETWYTADNYDEIERMTKEWRAELEAKEKTEERERMRKEEEKGKGKVHWSEKVKVWVESDDEDEDDSRRKPEGAQHHTSPSPSDEQRRKINTSLPEHSPSIFFDLTNSDIECESSSTITSWSDDPQDDTPYADRVAWKPSDPDASILDYICVECDLQLRHCECPSSYKEPGRLPSGWDSDVSAPTTRNMEEYVRAQLDGGNDNFDDEDMRLGDSVGDQKMLLASLLPPPSWQPTRSHGCQTKLKSPQKLAHQKKRNKNRTRKHSSGSGQQKPSIIGEHERKTKEDLKGQKRPHSEAEVGEPHPKRRRHREHKPSQSTRRQLKEAAKDTPSLPPTKPEVSPTVLDSDESQTDHVAIKMRMTNWALRHASILPAPQRNLRDRGCSQAISLESMCGRYELLSTRADKSSPKQGSCGIRQGISELILNSNGASMYGRFRLEGGMHGLLKIPSIPKKSSTGGVIVHAVVEDHVKRDGSWVVPMEGDEKRLVDGKLMFLGPGFILVVHKRLGRPVFGLRVGHEYEEGRNGQKVEGVKESWNSVCEKFGGKDCSESLGELQEVTWDEDVIDELIDCLGES